MPLHTYRKGTSGHQSTHLAIFPTIRQGGQQVHSAIMTLQQHLAHASRTTEVTINLEWWMGIKQVGIGTATAPPLCGAGYHVQHVLDNLKGMVTILHTCPEVDLPTQTPASSHIAALVQGVSRSGKQIGMTVGRYLVRRIQAVQMRYMAMLIFWIIAINQPLLQLSVSTYLHRWQLGNGIAQHGGINHIIIAQYLVCPQRTAQHIKHYLVVHGRSGCYRGILAYRSMFRRYCWHRYQPAGSLLHFAVLWIFLHIRQQEIGSSFQDGIASIKESLVASIQVVLPQVRGKPGTTCWEHTPCGTIHRSRNTPQVGVMMRHPTRTVVHGARRLSACYTQVANHREQRFLCLSQITHIGRPVVHLGIDVDGIFRVPSGIHLMVPYTLQVGRLTTRLRR